MISMPARIPLPRFWRQDGATTAGRLSRGRGSRLGGFFRAFFLVSAAYLILAVAYLAIVSPTLLLSPVHVIEGVVVGWVVVTVTIFYLPVTLLFIVLRQRLVSFCMVVFLAICLMNGPLGAAKGFRDYVFGPWSVGYFDAPWLDSYARGAHPKMTGYAGASLSMMRPYVIEVGPDGIGGKLDQLLQQPVFGFDECLSDGVRRFFGVCRAKAVSIDEARRLVVAAPLINTLALELGLAAFDESSARPGLLAACEGGVGASAKWAPAVGEIVTGDYSALDAAMRGTKSDFDTYATPCQEFWAGVADRIRRSPVNRAVSQPPLMVVSSEWMKRHPLNHPSGNKADARVGESQEAFYNALGAGFNSAAEYQGLYERPGPYWTSRFERPHPRIGPWDYVAPYRLQWVARHL